MTVEQEPPWEGSDSSSDSHKELLEAMFKSGKMVEGRVVSSGRRVRKRV